MNNRVSEFGKFMRKLRIDRNLILKDVAKLLDVSSAFLSAVEMGQKSIPVKWIDIIPEKLSLNDIEKYNLEKAINASKHTITITQDDDVSLGMFMLLARKCTDISEEEIKKIISKLKRS